MRRSGKSKAEVERETGSTIGVYDADFEVWPSEFRVLGLLEREIHVCGRHRRSKREGSLPTEVHLRHAIQQVRELRRKR